MVRFLIVLVAASVLGGCMVKVKAPGVKVHANPTQVKVKSK